MLLSFSQDHHLYHITDRHKDQVGQRVEEGMQSFLVIYRLGFLSCSIAGELEILIQLDFVLATAGNNEAIAFPVVCIIMPSITHTLA